VSLLPLQKIKADDDNLLLLSDTHLTQVVEVHTVQLKCSKPCDGSYSVLFCYLMEILFSATVFLNSGNHTHTFRHTCTPACKEHSCGFKFSRSMHRTEMLELKMYMQHFCAVIIQSLAG